MPITLSGTRITVKYQSGDSKGNSWASPYTPADILAASNSGGWGVTYNGTTYFIPYSLYIDGDTTYFVMSQSSATAGESIHFNPSAPVDSYLLYSTANIAIGITSSTINTFGTVLSAQPTISSSKKYCAFLGPTTIRNTVFSEFYIVYVTGSNGKLINLYNCYANRCGFSFSINSYTSLYDVVSNGGNYGVQIAGVDTINGLYISNKQYGILSQGQPAIGNEVNFYNVKIKDCTLGDTYLRCGFNSTSYTYNFIDCEISPSRMIFFNSGTGSQTLTQVLKTTFTAVIENENGEMLTGVSFKLYGNNDELLLDSIIDETITQVIPYFQKYRKVIGGVTSEEGETNYMPFYAVVNKSGYDELIVKNIDVTAGIPTKIICVMTKEVLKISSLSFTHPTQSNNNGTITVQASGGVAPYQYSIDDGATWQSSGEFAGLAAGDYIVKVKDNEGTEVDGVTVTLNKTTIFSDATIEGTVETEVITGKVEVPVIEGELLVMDRIDGSLKDITGGI